jgi:hypothetical protein
VRATQSCVGNFDWAFAWSFAVRGKEIERKVRFVSAIFLRALEA